MPGESEWSGDHRTRLINIRSKQRCNPIVSKQTGGIGPPHSEPSLSLLNCERWAGPLARPGGIMESLRLAKRLQGMSGNVIREILKLTQQQQVISFAGGLPSPDGFPRAALQRIAHDVLENSGTEILQYATTEGSLPLREAIVELAAEQGIRATPDQVRILSGSQARHRSRHESIHQSGRCSSRSEPDVLGGTANHRAV